VPAKHRQELWRRFREPCDRFFARRNEHFERLDAARSGHTTQKTALCEQAEALAESTDWETTAAAIKQLQAEWKRIGPLPPAQAEALWQRFRTACDRFFHRRSRRGEIEREAAVQKGEALCGDLESLAASLQDDLAAEDCARRLDEAWAEWRRLELATAGEARALHERLHAACQRIAATRPECLRGTRLDPELTRKRREKLCARLESLADATSPAPREQSLREMALALRERLAANTIAGGARRDAKREDVEQELARITASWTQLGPALDDHARALTERFERAWASLRAGRNTEPGSHGKRTG
jgi:hypothetical protein